MRPLLEGFQEAHPNIEIEFSNAPPVTEYISRLQTRLLSNSASDIFIMAAENRNELIDGNFVYDLTDEDFMNVIGDINKSTYSKDERVFAMSVASWGGGIVYNKRLFEEAGIEKEPETWEEFIQICEQLQQAGITPVYDSIQDDLSLFFAGLVGAEVIHENPNFDEEVFNGERTFSEEWTKVTELYYELFEKGILDQNVLGINPDQVLEAFTREEVAMFLTGPWTIPTIENGNPDLDFHFMAIPGSEKGTSFFGGAASPGFAINKETENLDAALTFLEYIASPEGLEKYHEGTGAIITAQGFEPAIHPALEDVYVGLSENRYYLPMISWVRHQEALRKDLVVAIHELVLGSRTPAEVAERLDERLREIEG
jgi:raffinose/stachyose/melibiose transport system substrate-binding protein